MDEKEEFLKTIGNNLRRFRNLKNISQQELADISNIAKSTIQRIESGKLNPTIVMLQTISKSLDITLSALVEIH